MSILNDFRFSRKRERHGGESRSTVNRFADGVQSETIAINLITETANTSKLASTRPICVARRNLCSLGSPCMEGIGEDLQ